MNFVEYFNNKKQFLQRSDEWYNIRHQILTASSIASILDANPYMSKLDLLIEKSKPLDMINNKNNLAINWGIKYEPIAIQIYEQIKNEKIHHVGLFIHDIYNWLGASPDGLRENGKLLEIKCVWNRKITKLIPLYYWIQVQIQLEVCDLDECDLFQCKFIEYSDKLEYDNDTSLEYKKGIFEYNDITTYWKLYKYSINTIKRDKTWFEKNKDRLYSFWKDMTNYKNIGYEKIYENIKYYSDFNLSSTSIISKKRKIDNKFINNDDNININDNNNININNDKKIKIEYIKNNEYVDENWSKWINSTDIKNYILNDPIIDWLNLYGNEEKKDKYNDFNDFLTNKEIDFINAVNENLIKRFLNDITIIAHINEKFSINKYYDTINEMKIGRPIIINGLLHNKINNTYGISNLIVRNDFINKIINNDNIKINNNIKSNIGYNYSIIGIKYISLTIKNNYLSNIGNISPHKSELIILNEALINILGYIPDKAFLLGKKYKFNNNIFGLFDNIAIIDMLNNHKLVNKIHNGLKWLKDVKDNGKNWDILNPHRNELYPNMSNLLDFPWKNHKKYIANKISEITLLWNCGVNERKKAHQSGIYKWNDITSSLINFKGDKYHILNNILNINKSNDKIITNIHNNINRDKLEFFVDFETVNHIDFNFNNIVNYNEGLSTSYPLNNNDNYNDVMIYMIGIGWNDPITKEWNFKNFIVKRLNYNCEKEIIIEWIDYMNYIKYKFNIINNIKVYHWSKAEVTFSNKALKRHNIDTNINWCDLLDYFKNNHIAIKGVFNYGLKNIAKELYKNNYIKTKWDNNDIDGIEAMLVAWECEKKSIDNNKNLSEYEIMNDIVKYNEIDCKVIMDILSIL